MRRHVLGVDTRCAKALRWERGLESREPGSLAGVYGGRQGLGTQGLVSCGDRHLDGKPGTIAMGESRQEETQSDWYSAGGGISGIVERWSPRDFLVTRCRRGRW